MRRVTLEDFVRESNLIEGIDYVERQHVRAHETLMERETITIEALCQFVSEVEPEAVLRDRDGLNVRVGSHIAPRGGVTLVVDLESLLWRVNKRNAISAYDAHIEYETLHPFTDGNGRSGRALWLWLMRRDEWGPITVRTFLHEFYYQTLEASRKRPMKQRVEKVPPPLIQDGSAWHRSPAGGSKGE